MAVESAGLILRVQVNCLYQDRRGSYSMSINVKDGSRGAGRRDQKYGKYREAWHMLLEACQGVAGEAIDIRACSDEAAEKAVHHRGIATQKKAEEKTERLVIFSVSLG
jgi:hypothetical protein